MVNLNAALSGQQDRDINSPYVRVRMFGGAYAYINLDAAGASSFEVQRFGDSTEFNSRMLISDGERIYNYTTDGQSLIGIATVPTTKFKIDGATIGSYYISGTSTNEIRAVFSGNGLTWGASTLIFSGGSVIRDIAVANPSQIYLTRRVEVSTTNTDNFFGLGSVRFNGATWGFTNLFYRFQEYDSDSTISAYSIDSENVDRIVLSHRLTSYNGINYLNLGEQRVTVINSDGAQLFGSKDLFVAPYPSEVAFGNISKGRSFYWTLLYYKKVDVANPQQFDSFNNVSERGFYVTKSVDLWDWTTPLLVPFERLGASWWPNSTSIQFDGAKTYSAVLVAGVTAPYEWTVRYPWGYTLSALGRSEVQLSVFLGTTPVDISNEVSNYQNTDNKTVRITLKNFE